MNSDLIPENLYLLKWVGFGSHNVKYTFRAKFIKYFDSSIFEEYTDYNNAVSNYNFIEFPMTEERVQEIRALLEPQARKLINYGIYSEEPIGITYRKKIQPMDSPLFPYSDVAAKLFNNIGQPVIGLFEFVNRIDTTYNHAYDAESSILFNASYVANPDIRNNRGKELYWIDLSAYSVRPDIKEIIYKEKALEKIAPQLNEDIVKHELRPMLGLRGGKKRKTRRSKTIRRKTKRVRRKTMNTK